MKNLFILLLLLIFPIVTSADEGKITQHNKDTMSKVTENGKFAIEIIVNQEELKVGLNTMKFSLHDVNNNALEGALITIMPWMPDMGHGVKTKPVVTEEGKGLYNADNIEFSMSGLWILKIIVKKDDIEDKAVFTFPHIKSTKKFY
jgi:hypothetical protein